MAIKNYVSELTAEQAEKLRSILIAENWELDDLQYALFRARKNKTTCVAYESGKLVIQGKGTEELVQFILEPRVLEEVKMGYETFHAREKNPEMFEPHAGIDESGKGDFFGPMITACVYTDEDRTTKLFDLGVQDSKNIRSDKKIDELARQIKDICKGRIAVVRLGNEAYNRMHEKMKNVNLMLAWSHCRALENVLERQPDCPRALADQFARNPNTLKRFLQERGKKIKFEQMVRAESDIAVAAASIIARDEFVKQMDKLAKDMGLEKIPRGASKQVLDAAVEIIKSKGPEALRSCAKLHFRTYQKALEAAGH